MGGIEALLYVSSAQKEHVGLRQLLKYRAAQQAAKRTFANLLPVSRDCHLPSLDSMTTSLRSFRVMYLPGEVAGRCAPFSLPLLLRISFGRRRVSCGTGRGAATPRLVYRTLHQHLCRRHVAHHSTSLLHLCSSERSSIRDSLLILKILSRLL